MIRILAARHMCNSASIPGGTVYRNLQAVVRLSPQYADPSARRRTDGIMFSGPACVVIFLACAMVIVIPISESAPITKTLHPAKKGAFLSTTMRSCLLDRRQCSPCPHICLLGVPYCAMFGNHNAQSAAPRGAPAGVFPTPVTTHRAPVR